MDKGHINYLTPELLNSDEQIWVNPVGGLGDILMLSTAMKRSYDIYGKKFNIARRTQYTEFFANHPAVGEIGHPSVGSYIVCNDYWMREDFVDVSNTGLKITSRIFGVEQLESDELYLPDFEMVPSTQILLDTIPWGEKNVAIVFTSDSPRKMMHPIKWHIIVDKLLAQHCFVAQFGRMGDIPIQGAYSLLGATTPMQVFELLKKFDLVITLDNFIMHAAKAVHTPTVALFGPTEAARYGYKDHICLQADISKCEFAGSCLGPHVSQNYATPCPRCEQHCMNSFDENKIVNISLSILNK